MANYWENNLFPQFLSTIDDCTLASYTNFQIQNELNNLAKRAIAQFKFPTYPLNYGSNNETNPNTGEEYGYYFIDERIDQKEFNVIVARMKQYWVEFQISQERLFANLYYDREIRLHSPGNTIDKLIKMFKNFERLAEKAEYDYYRVTSDNTPTLGGINDD